MPLLSLFCRLVETAYLGVSSLHENISNRSALRVHRGIGYLAECSEGGPPSRRVAVRGRCRGCDRGCSKDRTNPGPQRRRGS
jgi:hypothetical protein